MIILFTSIEIYFSSSTTLSVYSLLRLETAEKITKFSSVPSQLVYFSINFILAFLIPYLMVEISLEKEKIEIDKLFTPSLHHVLEYFAFLIFNLLKLMLHYNAS